jgi:hypothetical protein
VTADAAIKLRTAILSTDAPRPIRSVESDDDGSGAQTPSDLF